MIMDRRLLVEECSRLKAQVAEVEGTMKETLESMDKLQADLDEAIASKLGLRIRLNLPRIKWPCCNAKS